MTPCPAKVKTDPSPVKEESPVPVPVFGMEPPPGISLKDHFFPAG